MTTKPGNVIEVEESPEEMIRRAKIQHAYDAHGVVVGQLAIMQSLVTASHTFLVTGATEQSLACLVNVGAKAKVVVESIAKAHGAVNAITENRN